eukprot:39980-Eustigmatos_ZCMA.PRE.1
MAIRSLPPAARSGAPCLCAILCDSDHSVIRFHHICGGMKYMCTSGDAPAPIPCAKRSASLLSS